MPLYSKPILSASDLNNGLTGTGLIVLATAPTITSGLFVTPSLGVGTATSLAIGGATIGSNTLAVTGTANVSGAVTLGSLTATRVPFAGVSGLLSDASTLTFNSGTGALSATTFVGALTGNASTASSVAVGGLTGAGTGVLTALAINIGSAGAFLAFNGAGGTPSSLVGTNISGTAASLTAGSVTTNANLTGPITSVGNATSIASQTGTGSTIVTATAPSITNPAFSPTITVTTSPSSGGSQGVNVTDGTRSLNIYTTGSAYSYHGVGANQTMIYSAGNTLNILSDGQAFNIFTGASSTASLSIDTSQKVTLNGVLAFGTAASGVVLKQGANGLCGTFVANGTSAVTVSNTNVAITDCIIISLNTVGGTVSLSDPAIQTITAGTGFTVKASTLDTSTYNYAIIKNAA